MAHARPKEPRRGYPLQLGARGRVVLPTRVRKELGLREGDPMVLTVEPDGSLRMVSLRGQVRKLEGLYRAAAPRRRLVDELLRERSTESRREHGR